MRTVAISLWIMKLCRLHLLMPPGLHSLTPPVMNPLMPPGLHTLKAHASCALPSHSHTFCAAFFHATWVTPSLTSCAAAASCHTSCAAPSHTSCTQCCTLSPLLIWTLSHLIGMKIGSPSWTPKLEPNNEINLKHIREIITFARRSWLRSSRLSLRSRTRSLYIVRTTATLYTK